MFDDSLMMKVLVEDKVYYCLMIMEKVVKDVEVCRMVVEFGVYIVEVRLRRMVEFVNRFGFFVMFLLF